ncbi:MAG: hypothetical protein KF689_06520 [Gemmatimonadaceae bacterium]|nr:hypothetical protein [Gemmatimonadaceae bacterium]MCW5825172.1 hypothetical protein [Gemmatimonadaceae bacterium]
MSSSIRVLVPALLALVAMPALAAAQACLGSPSFATNHLQLAGSFMFSSDFEELGAGFTSGSNSYFGGLGISSYAFDGSDANVRLGGRLGSQVPVSASGRVQACPLLSASYGLTTKDYNGTGGDLHTQSYGLGLAIGGELMRSNRVALVPSVSATVLRDVFRVTGGLAPTDDQDTYILAGAAVGIVLSDALAIRPAVAFPINAAFDEPVFSIGLVLNYGGRR